LLSWWESIYEAHLLQTSERVVRNLFVHVGYIKALSYLGCIWDCDFVNKKFNFKLNRRKWIIQNCVSNCDFTKHVTAFLKIIFLNCYFKIANSNEFLPFKVLTIQTIKLMRISVQQLYYQFGLVRLDEMLNIWFCC